MAKRVLTVDDSKTMRDMVSFTLKGGGYETMEAGDGQEALSTLGDAPIDLIITDLNMPVMDGLSFIRAVRARDEYKFVPILMLTARRDAYVAGFALLAVTLGAGMSWFLTHLEDSAVGLLAR